MKIAYDGTLFGGWAVQPNRTTIQGILQKALLTILRQPAQVHGAGRTDAGVHAHEQCAHFSSDEINIEKTLYSLNSIIPDTIKIYSISPAEETFHARFSVKKKIYIYHFTHQYTPFNQRFSLLIPKKFNHSILTKAASLFVGTKDFSGFASSGCGSRNKIKTLYNLDIVPTKTGFALRFIGDGFLYKMVRNITGTLIEIAQEKKGLDCVTNIFKSQNRTNAGFTAPAKGLFLRKIEY